MISSLRLQIIRRNRNDAGMQESDKNIQREKGGFQSEYPAGCGKDIWTAWRKRKRKDDMDEDDGQV